MIRRLPREVRTALAKAVSDLDWAVRMFQVSVAPEAVDVPRLARDIEAALVAGQNAAIAIRNDAEITAKRAR
jgi:hypothetical protein